MDPARHRVPPIHHERREKRVERMAVSMWFIADVFFLLLASIQRFEIQYPDVTCWCEPFRMVRHRFALMRPMASTTHQ